MLIKGAFALARATNKICQQSIIGNSFFQRGGESVSVIPKRNFNKTFLAACSHKQTSNKTKVSQVQERSCTIVVKSVSAM